MHSPIALCLPSLPLLINHRTPNDSWCPRNIVCFLPETTTVTITTTVTTTTGYTRRGTGQCYPKAGPVPLVNSDMKAAWGKEKWLSYGDPRYNTEEDCRKLCDSKPVCAAYSFKQSYTDCQVYESWTLSASDIVGVRERTTTIGHWDATCYTKDAHRDRNSPPGEHKQRRLHWRDGTWPCVSWGEGGGVGWGGGGMGACVRAHATRAASQFGNYVYTHRLLFFWICYARFPHARCLLCVHAVLAMVQHSG